MSADFGWVQSLNPQILNQPKSEVVCIPSVDKSADMSLTPLLLHTPHDADASPPRPGTCRRRRRRCPTQRPAASSSSLSGSLVVDTHGKGTYLVFTESSKGGLENHPISSKVSPLTPKIQSLKQVKFENRFC